MNRSEFAQGARDGVPIAAGYFAVSFSFGIAARAHGLGALECGVMSASNMTSAGQFASLAIISAGGSLLLMAVTQFVVNLRYALMSAALSQKLGPEVGVIRRLLVAFCLTDEIFALSALREGRLDPMYTWGVMSAALPGWTLGAACGAGVGDVLPESVLLALGVAIYGMFIAIVVPPAHRDRGVAAVVIGSMALSFAATKLPVLSDMSGGSRTIVLTLVIAAAAALLDPDAASRSKR